MSWPMTSRPEVREAWEEIYRQTHSTLTCLTRHSLKLLTLCLLIYVLLAVAGVGFYVNEHRYQRSNKPETVVIILTYMRSGSTFTAELFQAHPDVFFMFEPLHYIWYNKPHVLAFLRQQARQFLQNDFWKFIDDLKLEWMSKFLKCSFIEVDVMSLLQRQWEFSKSTKPYRQCVNRNPGVIGMESCLPVLTTRCERSKLTLIKTINFTMNAVGKLMAVYPNLKVIYLLRDPRATLWSRVRCGEVDVKNFMSHAKEFCDTVNVDIEEYSKLKTKFTERIQVVRYEDIAGRPLPYTQKLYNFVELSLTEDVKERVVSITSGSHDETCPLCVVKANSSRTSQQWRNHIPYNFAKVVGEMCSHVFKTIGYKPIRDKNMLVRNESLLTLPLISPL